jgi:hypothetical protein
MSGVATIFFPKWVSADLKVEPEFWYQVLQISGKKKCYKSCITQSFYVDKPAVEKKIQNYTMYHVFY